jgi:hypothetical protein
MQACARTGSKGQHHVGTTMPRCGVRTGFLVNEGLDFHQMTCFWAVKTMAMCAKMSRTKWIEHTHCAYLAAAIMNDCHNLDELCSRAHMAWRVSAQSASAGILRVSA